MVHCSPSSKQSRMNPGFESPQICSNKQLEYSENQTVKLTKLINLLRKAKLLKKAIKEIGINTVHSGQSEKLSPSEPTHTVLCFFNIMLPSIFSV